MNNGIFKSDKTTKTEPVMVQVVLKNKTVKSIEVSAIIAVRIFEGDRKNETTLLTTGAAFDLEPITHYECIEQLGAKSFFVCNRNYVVNKNHVVEADYQQHNLKLSNGTLLEFKESKTEMIKKYLNRS